MALGPGADLTNFFVPRMAEAGNEARQEIRI